MQERYQRCRFADCAIHQGWTREKQRYTDEQIADMREDKAREMTLVEIGQLWGIPASYVWYLINRTNRGMGPSDGVA